MSINRLLDDIKKDYLAVLPGKLDKIRDLKNKGELLLVRDEFHKLKGSGKTYGFPEISTLCEKLETLCKLNHPEINSIIDHGISVLGKIHAGRQNQNPLDLTQDEEFKIIESK